MSKVVNWGRWCFLLFFGLFGLSQLIVGVAELAGRGEIAKLVHDSDIRSTRDILAHGFRDTIFGLVWSGTVWGVFKLLNPVRILAYVLLGYALFRELLNIGSIEDVLWAVAYIAGIVWLSLGQVRAEFAAVNPKGAPAA
jgi:hypothetical protein